MPGRSNTEDQAAVSPPSPLPRMIDIQELLLLIGEREVTIYLLKKELAALKAAKSVPKAVE